MKNVNLRNLLSVKVILAKLTKQICVNSGKFT